jgi:hypothetical protein
MDGLEKRDAGEPTERRSTDLQIETGERGDRGVSVGIVEGGARVAICQSGTVGWQMRTGIIKSGNRRLSNDLGGDWGSETRTG